MPSISREFFLVTMVDWGVCVVVSFDSDGFRGESCDGDKIELLIRRSWEAIEPL